MTYESPLALQLPEIVRLLTVANNMLESQRFQTDPAVRANQITTAQNATLRAREIAQKFLPSGYDTDEG